VLKFLSINSIVIAPANTGNEERSNDAVTYIDHTNNGIRYIVIPGARPLEIVTKKLIAPPIDDAPAK